MNTELEIMNAISLTVSTTNSRQIPNINIGGSWLPDMGFIDGALVQGLPEQNGMDIRLCDANIKSYRELYRVTEEQNGSLFQASSYTQKGTTYPKMNVCGKFIFNCGLTFDDPVIAKYTYGLVQVRKVPDTVSIVGSVAHNQTGEMLPVIRINDKWLAECGFVMDAPITAKVEPDCISITLHENDIEKYNELVKYARANKQRLLQVRRYRRKGNPYIELDSTLLEKAGFYIGDIFNVTYTYGLICLNKLQYADFGF